MGTLRPLGPGDALIVVDVQRDFLPGGSLAVPRGDEVVPVLNRYIACGVAAGVPVVATRDWHPSGHVSFRSRGGPWPPHCVAGSPGAAFADSLALPATAVIVSKAADPERDAYSGFDGTDLERLLLARGSRRVLVGGLATDYCVRLTVLDALRLGFEAVWLADAVRAVDVRPGDGAAAERAMREAGAAAGRIATLCPGG
jgi:nicotinamidase/pyrazinamidase